MALVNYTLPFGNIQAPAWATASPLQNHHASAVNNLLYGPAGHQGDDQDYYKNAPYAPPQRQAKQSPQQQQQHQQHSIQYRQTPRNNYLPPPSYVPPSPANYPQAPTPPPQTQQPPGRTYGEGSYSDTGAPGSPPNAGVPQQPTAQQPAYYEYSSGSYATQPGRPFTEQHANPQTGTNYRSNTPQPVAPAAAAAAVPRTANGNQGGAGSYVQRPAVFASVGPAGTRTSIHPVLDYDEEEDDDYYDEAVEVTPIVGIS
uniref:Uncharacterized protein n=1 Tax=Anopheles christyi TaxID=43041 RepID=A0A182K849_9DIPT